MPSKNKARRDEVNRAYRARKRGDPKWMAKRRAYNAQHWRQNRERSQFNVAKYQAKKRGLEFSIGFEDITWPEFCPVFGRRLERSETGGPNDWSPSLDRIDSARGYVPGNVIVVSMRANRIKSNATVVELERVTAFYKGL